MHTYRYIERQRIYIEIRRPLRIGMLEYPSVRSYANITICHMLICPYGPDLMIICPYDRMMRIV